MSRFHPLLVVGGLTLIAYLMHAAGLGNGAGDFSQLLLAPVQLTGLGLLVAGAPFTPVIGILALCLFLAACLLLDRAASRIFLPWQKATKRSSPS